MRRFAEKCQYKAVLVCGPGLLPGRQCPESPGLLFGETARLHAVACRNRTHGPAPILKIPRHPFLFQIGPESKNGNEPHRFLPVEIAGSWPKRTTATAKR